MDVLGAMDLLRKYNLYDRAIDECKRKDHYSPYNMTEYHKIFCSYLSNKRTEVRKKCDELQNVNCFEFEKFSQNSRFHHDSCKLLNLLNDEFCKSNCKYYHEKLAILKQEINDLNMAEKALIKAAKEDFWSK